MPTLGVFRRLGDDPPVEWFGTGAWVNGWQVDLLDIESFNADTAPTFDAVAVGGGLERYDGRNWQVVEHYNRRHDIPAVIVEFSWLRPGYVFTYLNRSPWVPPAAACDASRRAAQGFTFSPQLRGDVVLIAGQRPDLDCQLEDAVANIAGVSSRRIHYRRHPNAKRFAPNNGYTMPHAHTDSDEFDIPSAQASLNDDLRNAWAVVTHSSNVGHEALLRGIPVFSHREAAFAHIARPLGQAWMIDHTEPAHRADVDRHFDRLAFAHWSHEELRSGAAFRFLEEQWQASDCLHVQVAGPKRLPLPNGGSHIKPCSLNSGSSSTM